VDVEAALGETVRLLRETAPPTLVNQYTARDPALDHPDGPGRRVANLTAYLRAFRAPRLVLCAEAAGFNGSRFSGITLCDERKLVGPDHLAWAGPHRGYARGSRDDQPLHRELSASIVWRALGDRTDVALWNCVPWHPAGPGGPLSNRTPTPAEQAAGLAVLDHVLTHLWPSARPIAVGRVAEGLLQRLGRAVPTVRHPANGGARLFTEGLHRLL
jgi:uracil-DNA glycosylase